MMPTKGLFILCVLLTSSLAQAQVPTSMQFQGYLTDADGEPLSGPHNITFTLYGSEAGSDSVWTSTETVIIEAGAFTATLGGQGNPLDANIFGTDPLWLGVAVDAGEELTPRTTISSVPYATRAAVADNAMSEARVQTIIDDGGYLTEVTETDPVYGNAPASGISSAQVSNWDACYAWGDHGTAGYIDDAYANLDSAGYLDFTEEEDLVTKGQVVTNFALTDELNSTMLLIEELHNNGEETNSELNDALDRIAVLESLLHKITDWCEKDLDNCDENAACTDTETGFTCECNAGYTGDGVACDVDLDYWTWTDPVTGYVWQKSDAGSQMTQANAISYCNGLTLAGSSAGDWRLPTISELRSLIQGCAAQETGGSCGVTDSCLLDGSCYSGCTSCGPNGGPDGGCYWPSPIEGSCSSYWSSSPVEDYGGYYWQVGFDTAIVFPNFGGNDIHVRCVR